MGVVLGSPILWNRDNFTGKWPDFKEVDSYSIALNDFYPIVFPVELHKYTCAMLAIPNVIVSPDNDRVFFIVAILFNTVNKFFEQLYLINSNFTSDVELLTSITHTLICDPIFFFHFFMY